MTKTLFYNAQIFNGTTMIENGALFVEDGKITEIFNSKDLIPMAEDKVNLDGALLVPGFIDTHIHGFRGFSLHEQSEEQVLGVSEALAHYGTTSFIATISRATADKEEILGDICAVVRARGREKGACILGIHLEGPFLSMVKKGGQSASGIAAVDLGLLEEMWNASEGIIKNMTVAPELDGIEELTEFCREKGIVLQAGHTDANYEQMKKAIAQGIKHATHTFNAMTGLHHRKPGVIGALLEDDEVSCEVIADGFHVNPAVVRILAKCKGEDNLVLITDSQKYSKTDIETFTENGVEYVLGKYFYRKVDGTLVGANVTIYDEVRNLVEWGISLPAALKAASANPARILNLSGKGKIEKGGDADFNILDNNLNLLHTFIGGKKFEII